MNPTSRPYAEMVKKFSDVNELTIKDRRPTFHGYNLENALAEHIDYCFINEKIQPVAFKILDELIEGKFPSDHYGIYAELEIR